MYMCACVCVCVCVCVQVQVLIRTPLHMCGTSGKQKCQVISELSPQTHPNRPVFVITSTELLLDAAPGDMLLPSILYTNSFIKLTNIISFIIIFVTLDVLKAKCAYGISASSYIEIRK